MNIATIKPNKQHVGKLIDFLYNEILSAGGDGDAIWYSKYFSLEDIAECIREYDEANNINWHFEIINDTLFNWGIDQEWMTVTTSKEEFEKTPDWNQIKIIY